MKFLWHLLALAASVAAALLIAATARPLAAPEPVSLPVSAPLTVDLDVRSGPRFPVRTANDVPDCPDRGYSGVGPYHRQSGRLFVGCVTGYSVASNGGTQTFCGPPLSDSLPTTSVAKRYRLTVAPCGSLLRVSTLDGRRSLRVRVTDQGPCNDPPGCWDNIGRDLDLSYAASVAFKGRGDWARPVLLRWTVLSRGKNPPWG